jgi:hypothetical protein
MSRFFSSRYAELTPYVPGEQPIDQPYIKLNTNENPYAPSLRVLPLSPQDLHMNLYPEPTAYGLRKVIADMNSFSPEEIFVGNGSDEVLAFAFGLSAEIERRLISERTREALSRKKSEGMKLGRKPGTRNHHYKLDAFASDISEALFRGESQSSIARRLGVTRSTLALWIKRNNVLI